MINLFCNLIRQTYSVRLRLCTKGELMQAFYENKSSEFYCWDIKSRKLDCPMHLHYNIEIAFIYEGKTSVSVDNHSPALALGGDVILVFPNQIHRFETIENERHVLFIADPKTFPEFSSIFNEYLPVENIIRGAAKDEELRALTEKISKVYSEPASRYKDAVLHGYMLSFLGRLFEKVKFKKINAENIHVIGIIMNYCAAHYNENLSLDSLERALHINKYYISHIMNKKLNMNFNDYINSIRVSNACKKLCDSDVSITEISAEVGFNTVRTFNRAFMKSYGISPRDYRSRHSLKGGEKE